MRTILIIAKNTFRQAIRDKILYGIIIFALLFIGSTVVLSSLSLSEEVFVIRNFGLAGIYLFSLIITIFLGALILHKEVEEKVTYLLLAKPVTRTDMVIGKFLGLLAGIGATVVLMTTAYLIIVALNGGGIDYPAILAIVFQLMELALLLSMLILFSIFTTPFAATIYIIFILYIGHLLTLIQELAVKSGGVTKVLFVIAYYIFPNLEKFNIRNLVGHQITVTPNEILLTLGYAVTYTLLAIYLAKTLLNHKEL